MEDYKPVFEQRGEWWIAYAKNLPGANTQGATLAEARENLQDAIKMILEANREIARRKAAEPDLP